MNRQKNVLYAAWLTCVVLTLLSAATLRAGETQPDNLFEMSLEELMAVPVTTTSLTDIEGTARPFTVTTITRQDIQKSGARSLDELLEIYVPNLQMMIHSAKLPHLGLRGVISNRDDKYMLVVNGVIMNERTDFGVMSERDLPMLRDIYQIDVIRGPGSALYGPGALSMVINITTESTKTFQGMEVNQRVGVVEEHYTTEFKYGKKLKNEAGLYVFGGYSHYPGMSQQDAPLVYGTSATHRDGITYDWNDQVTSAISNYNEAYHSRPRAKFHMQYEKDNLTLWTRFTQGGTYIDTNGQANYATWLFGEGYRQGTMALDYKQEISDDFSIKYLMSYDRFEVESTPYGRSRYRNYREDEYFGRVIANWQMNDQHQLAFGGSWSHEEFGLPPTNEDDAIIYTMPNWQDLNTHMPRWSTDMFSLFAEHQWKINDQWVTFFSIRHDDHSYVDHMLSPRISINYMPSDKDLLRFIASRSVRTNTASTLKDNQMGGVENTDPEILKAYELRYERHVSKHVWLGTGAFYHDQEMIGWVPDPAPGHPGVVGKENLWGLEAEAKYKKDKLDLSVSHGFTKLTEFELSRGVSYVEDTAAPNGYGNDLANWYNNITKLQVRYQLTEKMEFDSSLIAYWDNPGGEDWAKFRQAELATRYDDRSEDVFYDSWFLNMGLEYRHSDNLSIRFDAYHILGWFEEELNTRRHSFNVHTPGMHRIIEPSFGVQVTYTF
jgi:iron complex outermembrane receptor protein